MNSNINPDVDADGYIKEFIIKKSHNFAIAIDTKDGLSVPIIKNVQSKSIIQINDDIQELRERADRGGLTHEDFENGTFSVSSVGNIGGTYMVPTILRP